MALKHRLVSSTSTGPPTYQCADKSNENKMGRGKCRISHTFGRSPTFLQGDLFNGTLDFRQRQFNLVDGDTVWAKDICHIPQFITVGCDESDRFCCHGDNELQCW